jgi:O-antigen ligase
MILAPFDRLIDRCKANSRVSDYLETFIVFTLSVSMAVIFFDVPRWTRAFGEAGFVALLLWAIYHKRNPVNPIPKPVITISVLYILSYVVNVFMSPDPTWEHVNIRKYIYIIIGGLLFAFPLKNKYRSFMIIVLCSSASIVGLQGIYQYYKGGMGTRSEGFSGNALHYAGLIGIVCCTAILLLFIRDRKIFESKLGTFFLSITSLLTFLGILFSQSRGVWVAIIISITITIFLYDKRKTLHFIFYFMMMLSVIFYFFEDIRNRATLIITSIATEDINGSTGTRIELCKGSYYIFKESPVLGVGTGNFEQNIDRLINNRIVEKIPTKMHAHNIYFQALATRGFIGFTITLAFFFILIKWGIEKTRYQDGVRGYIIVVCTLFTVFGGLTENNFEFTRYLAVYCCTVGLFGPPCITNEKSVLISKSRY